MIEPTQRERFEVAKGGLRTARIGQRFGDPRWSDKPTRIERPSVVAGLTHSLALRYNAAGQITELTESGFSPLTAQGQLASSPQQASPIGRTQRWVYQTVAGVSVLTAHDGPLPNGPKASPEDSDITRYTWDARGTQLLVVERSGGRSEVRYDDVGRPREWLGHEGEHKWARDVKWMPKTGTAATDTSSASANEAAKQPPRRLVAQPKESIALVATSGRTGTAELGHVLEWSTPSRQAVRLMDDFGRVVAIQNPGQAWQTGTYDAASRLIQVLDPKGNSKSIAYDVAGRAIRVVTQNTSGNIEQTTTITWQGPFKASESIEDHETHQRHVSSYQNDNEGRVLTQHSAVYEANAPQPVAQWTLRSTFDENRRLIAQTLPSGMRLAYRYVESNKTQPASSQPIAAVDHIRWPQWLDMLMVPLARLVPETWLPMSRLAWLPVVSDMEDVAQDVGAEASTEAEQVQANREPQVHPGLQPYAGEQLDAAALPGRWPTSAGTLALDWNAAGQLRSVQTPGQAAVRYAYDAQGRRYHKQSAYSDTYYFYVGTQLVAWHSVARGAVKRHNADAQKQDHEYVYVGYQPVAWRQGEQVYALQTDQRGAVTAVAELGSDADKPLWLSHINAWGALPVSGADKQTPHLMDPGLRLINQLSDPETGLSYHIARYYDSRTGRFISPDPAGVADSLDERTPSDLKLDLTAYVSGQPLHYFDPDGAAKITYFAITTGDKGQALGQIQGFTRARWAFVIEDIRPGGNANTDLGKLRKQYAQNGTQLLFDAGGNFISGFGNIDASKNEGNTALRWDKGSADNVLQAFASHYGNNRISATQFTINDVDDDNAARLIWYLSSSAAVRKTCAATAPGWLPEIKFAPEEANIKVTQTNANGTNGQRILNCNRPSTLPVTYASDEERRRVVKYEAAAELQESPAESAIYKDCSTNHGCRSATAITVNGRSYYASYGRTQFVAETFLRTLRNLIPNLTEQERQALGLNQAIVLPNGTNGTMANMVTIAVQRAERAARAYEGYRRDIGQGLTADQAAAAWNALTPAQRNQFIADTGLGQAEFIDMLGYQPSGRARTEAEGKNAFGTEAAMRLLDGSGRAVFGTWLMDLFKSQDNYNFISKRFLQRNLADVLGATQLAGQFTNAETPNTAAHQARQREIEENLARRVAALHNWGNKERATAPTMNLPRFVQDYVNEFMGVAGRGDWQSMRCTDDSAGMRNLPGLQMKPLTL